MKVIKLLTFIWCNFRPILSRNLIRLIRNEIIYHFLSCIFEDGQFLFRFTLLAAVGMRVIEHENKICPTVDVVCFLERLVSYSKIIWYALIITNVCLKDQKHKAKSFAMKEEPMHSVSWPPCLNILSVTWDMFDCYKYFNLWLASDQFYHQNKTRKHISAILNAIRSWF